MNYFFVSTLFPAATPFAFCQILTLKHGFTYANTVSKSYRSYPAVASAAAFAFCSTKNHDRW